MGNLSIKLNQKAIAQLERDALRQFASQLQPALDRVFREHGGDPVNVVLNALRADPVLRELNTSADSMRGFAQVISNNSRPQLQVS